MEDDDYATKKMGRIKLEDGGPNGALADSDRGASIATPDQNDDSQSPATSLDSIKSRSESADTPSSNKPPQLSRRASRKSVPQEPQLCTDLPDVTQDACKAFQVIPDCLYGSKHLGSTDNDSFDCECREDWQNGVNMACGEDSDCINRATKMECSATTGNCSGGCQNQQFQRKQYAGVSVIKTEKKGYGLRAESDLRPNDFIFEYIGEVINEPTFRRRMLQYDDEGIKHFYFMSLNKSEFVDATKKGNLGRFCNHSCRPNCYVDKWVVGDKLRMGIFAERKIRAGEELVFNYNVDRYGADPQPCYCGESNCVGFIGGKTQTERSTKLPAATVEALGIDAGDGWDTTVAKKPRKKRADEDDEEYVNSIQARGLDEDDARKVMASLLQCKEKWIAVKLLQRIENCDEERVIHVVMRMHAYQILKTTLNNFIEDHNVVIQVLSILDKFPRLTRNKIQDSKIEAPIQGLTESEHEDVASRSRQLLDEWSKLEMGYRIRRRKVDPNAPATQTSVDDRRGGHPRDDEQSQATPKTASPQPIDAPKGPRNNVPQRNNAFFQNNARLRRPPPNAPLPQGWFAAKDATGNTYFYNKQGTTTWKRPTHPAPEPSQNKAMQEQLAIQSIIAKVTKEGTPKQNSSQTPKNPEAPVQDSKQEKWRSLPIDKQMKIYENTVFPPVKHVLDKFRNRLPKDELKRLGKEIAKKLVASDYKNNRVEDPTAKLSEKQMGKIKKYVKDFLDRAVEKFESHQKRKAGRDPQSHSNGSKRPDDTDGLVSDKPTDTPTGSPAGKGGELAVADEVDDAIMSDGEEESTEGSERKRKRGADMDTADSTGATPSDGPDFKRLKEDETGSGSPPPPPPPPPESAREEAMSEEQKALQEQEEALMRENEEAQRLDDEADKTKEMEEAAEGMQKDITAAKSAIGSNGEADQANGATIDEHAAQKQEVLSH